VLNWPLEPANKSSTDKAHWQHPESNISLDFHGNPNNPKLTVLSDGNHHMALADVMDMFVQQIKLLKMYFR